MQPDIVALGEPLLEFIEVAGENGALYRRGFGGDTSNCLVAAARGGGRAGYLTHLGSDSFARAFLDLWQAEGIDTQHVQQRSDSHTGAYFISYPDDAPSFTYFRSGSAASRVTPSDLPEAYIGGAKIFHASGISQAISATAADSVFAAMETARAAGVTVTYDTNYRPKLWPVTRARAIIEAAMARTDIALPSLDDARLLTGLESPTDVAAYFAALGPRIVVLKMGADGALLWREGQGEHFPAPTATPVDTTGAGDTFVGTVLARLSQDADLATAVRAGNMAAALATRGHGAVGPIPDRATVDAALARGGVAD